MTDFLTRLAQRALGQAQTAQPLIGSRFERGREFVGQTHQPIEQEEFTPGPTEDGRAIAAPDVIASIPEAQPPPAQPARPESMPSPSEEASERPLPGRETSLPRRLEQTAEAETITTARPAPEASPSQRTAPPIKPPSPRPAEASPMRPPEVASSQPGPRLAARKPPAPGAPHAPSQDRPVDARRSPDPLRPPQPPAQREQSVGVSPDSPRPAPGQSGEPQTARRPHPALRAQIAEGQAAAAFRLEQAAPAASRPGTEAPNAPARRPEPPLRDSGDASRPHYFDEFGEPGRVGQRESETPRQTRTDDALADGAHQSSRGANRVSPLTIRVTIGRVEVTANVPPAQPPPAQPARRGPELSLDEYLKKRSEGRR
jgi:hypothetical protein